MNYLAHLFLSRPDGASRVGNLLGDFRRGVSVQALAPPLRAGLLNHLCVDAFTDRHPEVVAARRGFSRQRRRFAGIALDVLFDHFLIRHWTRFSTVPLDVFVDRVYRDLRQAEGLMHAPMRARVRRLREQDWLRAYGQWDNVGRALDGIAGRLRFANDFGGAMAEIEPRERALEACFLAFFPALCAHVERRGIEALPSALVCQPVISGQAAPVLSVGDWHGLH